jgi:DNA-binding MarR family transcriptional regulator
VTAELDPLIHVPTRLRIVATLAALPDGDVLSFTRLQDMLGLTPGNLIIQLRKLEQAGYISSAKTRNGSTQKTTVALTSQGRTAPQRLHPGLARPARRPGHRRNIPGTIRLRDQCRGCEAEAAGRDCDQAAITLTPDTDPAVPAPLKRDRTLADSRALAGCKSR